MLVTGGGESRGLQETTTAAAVTTTIQLGVPVYFPES